MRLRKSAKAGAVIPTASMADIAFLLIIFFMVTTVHDVDRTSVNLPLAKTREDAEKGSALVVLARDKFGELYYMFSDGKNMSHSVNGPQDIYHEASRLTYIVPDLQWAGVIAVLACPIAPLAPLILVLWGIDEIFARFTSDR